MFRQLRQTFSLRVQDTLPNSRQEIASQPSHRPRSGPSLLLRNTRSGVEIDWVASTFSGPPDGKCACVRNLQTREIFGLDSGSDGPELMPRLPRR